jgi:hypothetical protein
LENDDCEIRIEAWVPLNVGGCPTVECHPPPSMGDFEGKKLKLTAIFMETPVKRFIDNTWTTVETYYEFGSVTNVSIIP